MTALKIGVFADNLGLGARKGIRQAAELGADGIQLYTTRGDMLPESLTPARRAELRAHIADQGLRLSATCSDFGAGLVDAERNRALIPRIQANINLAVDLGTSIITTHVGTVPERRDDPVWGVLARALNEIGAYAEALGVVLATETGPESGQVLRDLLEALDTNGVRVNFDPANLVMRGFDPLEALDALLPYVVHTHAKDGRYGGGELPLGQGDVPWEAYLARLRAHGYDGFYTIERESGDDPIGDVRAGIAFLRGL